MCIIQPLNTIPSHTYRPVVMCELIVTMKYKAQHTASETFAKYSEIQGVTNIKNGLQPRDIKDAYIYIYIYATLENPYKDIVLW